jgi:hypothetical protein
VTAELPILTAALGAGAVLAVTTIPDEALITINSLEILGIIYLAIAVSKLREKIARLEGTLEEEHRQESGRRDGA